MVSLPSWYTMLRCKYGDSELQNTIFTRLRSESWSPGDKCPGEPEGSGYPLPMNPGIRAAGCLLFARPFIAGRNLFDGWLQLALYRAYACALILRPCLPYLARLCVRVR